MTTATTTKPTVMTGPQQERITQIEAEILKDREAGKRNFLDTWHRARRIGERLQEAKKLLPHGQWTEWHRDRMGFSDQHVTKLIRIAKHWSELKPQIEQGSSVWDAVAALSTGKERVSYNRRRAHLVRRI